MKEGQLEMSKLKIHKVIISIKDKSLTCFLFLHACQFSVTQLCRKINEAMLQANTILTVAFVSPLRQLSSAIILTHRLSLSPTAFVLHFALFWLSVTDYCSTLNLWAPVHLQLCICGYGPCSQNPLLPLSRRFLHTGSNSCPDTSLLTGVKIQY